MKKGIIIFGIAFAVISCNRGVDMADSIQGYADREEIAVVGKIPGRIERILVNEGDFVKKGDTLAILEIPELGAKKAQAQGAVKSAEAQYKMAVQGATSNQLTQLEAKKTALSEQFEFAKKSLTRLEAMVSDSLIPQQQFDEAFAKFQGAQAQLIAVDAEISDVKNGVRLEQQLMALGQQDRALGALEEVKIAEHERYILAPQAMQIDVITLKTGELALPGYTLFKGMLANTTYFRFTLAESQLKEIERGDEVEVYVPYKELRVPGKIQHIKKIGSYANISTAYPDFELQDPLYEVVVRPLGEEGVEAILSKSTVILKP